MTVNPTKLQNLRGQTLLFRCLETGFVTTAPARIAEGTFPKQIPLGPRLVVWVESDIQNWIAEQVSAARG